MGELADRFDAVIFDWGGTLTRWHAIDFDAEADALAAAVHGVELSPAEIRTRLRSAGDVVWGRSRDHQRSATVADLFVEAGFEFEESRLSAYFDFWEPHTRTDEDVRPLFERLRAEGVKVGVLSNTLWPREWHVGFFERDGVYDLIDGDVYTSEIPWTKPSQEAFRAAMAAVGAVDPTRCAFVGDRPFDDIWGAQQVGMHAVLVPHSVIPTTQIGHSEGLPDSVAHRLTEIPDLLRGH